MSTTESEKRGREGGREREGERERRWKRGRRLREEGK